MQRAFDLLDQHFQHPHPVSAQRLGIGKDYTVTNVETGATYPVKDNAITLEVPIHAIIGLKLKANP